MPGTVASARAAIRARPSGPRTHSAATPSASSVFGARLAQQRDGVAFLAAGTGGRDGGVVALDHAGQHLDRGRRPFAFGVHDVVAADADVEIEAVGALPAGERNVEQLPGLAAGQDGVAGVDGLALGGVDGAGVAELDVLGDVVGGQR